MITAFLEGYFFLSNYYEVSITYNGITYQNNEAAFQAQKSTTPEAFKDLNPTEAKKLGRQVSLRLDWESVKVKVMQEIVHEKFSQNPDLAHRLIDTGDEYLEEGNTWGDRVWGVVNGQGANLLGQILMAERKKLQNKD